MRTAERIQELFVEGKLRERFDKLVAVGEKLTVRAFEDAGWRVAVDRPFSGALVPMRFYGTDRRVRGVMVEVNRALYMNETSGEKLEHFDDFARRLREALAYVIAPTSPRCEFE